MATTPVFSLFFIGFSVAWYALRGEQMLRQTAPSRLQRLLGYIFVWWGLSTLKDLALYILGGGIPRPYYATSST